VEETTTLEIFESYSNEAWSTVVFGENNPGFVNFFSVGHTKDLTDSDNVTEIFTAKWTGMITRAQRSSSCLKSIPFSYVNVPMVEKVSS